MLFRYLTGEIEMEFERRHTRRAFDTIGKLDIPFRECETNDETVRIYVPLYRKRALETAFERCEIEWKTGMLRGFPSVLKRYRRRWGIAVGAFIILLMVILSGRVIWCVNIEGNSNISDKEIISLLEKNGCGIGDVYKDIDFDSLHNKLLMENGNIAWISVNMDGTHANVEVRETMHGDKKEDDGFYNIVASESGQIEMIAAKEGKPVVEIYDTVAKGELLISGAISYKDTFNRFESADGSVYARVNRSFNVSVPLKYEKKVPTGEKTAKKSLEIFNFNINLFLKGGIPYEFCDKITNSEQVYLFDSLPLPLFVSDTVYTQYEIKAFERTKEEARSEALSLYREKLKEVLGEGELISRELSEEFNGECYTIKCSLYCIDDIAKKVPVVIEKESPNNGNTEAE